MKLRPYQEDAIQRVREEMSAGRRRVLLVIATGGGKTVTSSSIIKSAVAKGKRCIFLAHRKELIDQCSKTLSFLGVDHGVIKRGHSKLDLDKPVQVASIQTLIKWNHWPADLVVIDEAHRSMASTYQKLVERYETDKAAILGLSVGPKSFCEFRGGPFGTGWCGQIAEAYEVISDAYPDNEGSLRSFETFRTAELGIQSRGWNGKEFCWKDVKTFLRHECDREVSLVQAAGDRLLLTNDHSVYRAKPGGCYIKTGRPKYFAEIENAPAGDLRKGDTLLLDNGANWKASKEKLFDCLTLNTKLNVRVDFSDCLSRPESEASPSIYHSWKVAKFGEQLPADTFLRFEKRLPPPKFIYSGRGVRSERYIRLSDWAYIFGFYLGDGWVDGTRLCFAVENGQADTFLRRLKDTITGIKPIISDAAGASKEIRCSNSIVANLFKSVTGNAKASSKYIPGSWICSWPEEARRKLLAGLIDSDGHVSSRSRNRERVYYVTTSRRLSRTILSLLRSLGISGSVSIGEPELGGTIDGRRVVGRKKRYTINWSISSMHGNNSSRSGIRTKYEHQDLSFTESPIRRIGKPKTSPRFVYDLEMDGHPSFVANGVLVHNTATPYRLDGKPLGAMYNAMVETITSQELIDLGYLVNPTVFGSVNVDLSKVDVGSRGDYNRGQLGQAMASTILHGELLTNWARLCGGALGAETVWYKDSDGFDRVSETSCDACTAIFAPNVKKSIEIVEQFQEAGVKARHVDGKTRPRERRDILEGLAAGEIHVVSNVDILCEGWDLPRLECVIGARPTRSKNLYKQMGGRLMRPDDEKRIAFLLDHANWTRTHGFLYEPTKHSLEKPEKRPRRGAEGAPLKECPQCQSVSFIGATECPECGYIWPKGSIETTDEELVELDGQMVNRAEVVPRDERQEAFDKLATQCVAKGYKPNWARVRYQSAYGEWPSKNSGIMTPRFFRQYERELNKKLKQQMLTQAAADAAAS